MSLSEFQIMCQGILGSTPIQDDFKKNVEQNKWEPIYVYVRNGKQWKITIYSPINGNIRIQINLWNENKWNENKMLKIVNIYIREDLSYSEMRKKIISRCAFF